MDELMDNELAGMVNYIDETADMHMPIVERETKSHVGTPVVKALGCAYPNARRGIRHKVRDCAVWLFVSISIAALMAWFWKEGLMDMVAAYPCITGSLVIGAAGTAWSAK